MTSQSPLCLLAPAQHFLHLPDVRIHYRVFGEGPPLVMLHGLASSSVDWFPVTAMLADGHQLILIDLRGHGLSSLPRDRDYSIKSMAQDVWAVLDYLEMEQVAMLGLSLGGCVTIQSAILHPHRLREIVLVNTFAKLRGSGLKDAWSKMRRGIIAMQGMDKLAHYVANSLFSDPQIRAIAEERLRHNDVKAILRTMLALSRLNLLKDLSQITAPTLVMIGDRDKTVPRRCATELMAGIPRSQLVEVADAGHALPFDQPAAFVKHVQMFLDQKSGLR